MHTSTFWTAGLRCVLVFWVATCVGAARGHAADTNPPSFTLQPTNTTVLVGSNATFSALAAGTTPISYQWYHGSLLPGDVPLSGATSNGLTFAASETNTGPYYVAASNSFGLSTSAVAILTLRYAPVAITSQPADKTVTNGATVSFTVTVTGSKPQYQWFLGDTPLVNATNATLTLSNVTLGQMGYYQAMIWNVTNTVWSRSALLLVSRPPVAVMGTNQIWYFNDTGADLGTAWTAPVYSPASTWSNGPALLGFKCDASLNYQATDPNVAYGFQTFRTRMNRLSSFAGTNNITYYLRTTFTNDGTWLAPAASLVFSNLIDDGAVVYLNGMEINRSNMPSGPISYQTLASSAVNADHWIVNPVPVNLLLPGVNVLAVELHQASVSSADVDWLSLLTCTYATPTLLTFSNQPASLTVHEAENPLFSAGVSGPSSPLWTEYQWYKLAGGIPQAIPGATGSNLQITNVRFGVDGGDYFVTVSNPICYLVSSLAHLEVLVDTNPPVLLQADGTQSATNLQLLFSEAITAATATNLAGYAVQASTGESVTILSVTQTSPSNVVLITTPRAGGLNWIVQVSGMRDLSPAGNVIAPNSGLPITTLLKLAALDDPWTIANPVPGLDAPIEGNTWRGLDYVPTPDKWATRRAPFAISGRFPEEYPWPVNSKLSRGLTQACFRRELNPLASPAGARLSGNVYVMGGAAVFLNGTELARTNLAGGELSATNLALTELTQPAVLPINTDASTFLQAGRNVLAVDLRSLWLANWDLFFTADLSLQTESLAVGPVQILAGPASQTIYERDPVVFAVHCVGASQLQWYQDGVAIPGATGSTYALSQTPLALNGSQFSVAAWTGADSVTSASAVLTVLPIVTNPPPSQPAVTLSADNLTSSSGMVHGSINPGGFAPTKAWFDWGTSTNYGNAVVVTNGLVGQSPVNLSATLSNLTAATPYHYRLTASNCVMLVHGLDAVFTTTP